VNWGNNDEKNVPETIPYSILVIPLTALETTARQSEGSAVIEFFKAWRQKAGCVTLVMACSFMGIWVRARTVRDWISVPRGTAEYFFQIDDRGISLSKNKNLMHLGHFSERPIDWRISESIKGRSSNTDSLDKENDLAETLRHWWGLKVIRLEYLKNGHQETVLWWRSANWTIPNWSITIPLTLLSAYLLLSKPHKATQKKAPEPTPAEGR
jgi:hypothetical protein